MDMYPREWLDRLTGNKKGILRMSASIYICGASTFHLTYDPRLVFSRSDFDIAVFQE